MHELQHGNGVVGLTTTEAKMNESSSGLQAAPGPLLGILVAYVALLVLAFA